MASLVLEILKPPLGRGSAMEDGQGRDGVNGGQRDRCRDLCLGGRDRQVCHHQLRGIEDKRTASGQQN